MAILFDYFYGHTHKTRREGNPISLICLRKPYICIHKIYLEQGPSIWRIHLAKWLPQRRHKGHKIEATDIHRYRRLSNSLGGALWPSLSFGAGLVSKKERRWLVAKSGAGLRWVVMALIWLKLDRRAEQRTKGRWIGWKREHQQQVLYLADSEVLLWLDFRSVGLKSNAAAAAADAAPLCSLQDLTNVAIFDTTNLVILCCSWLTWLFPGTILIDSPSLYPTSAARRELDDASWTRRIAINARPAGSRSAFKWEWTRTVGIIQVIVNALSYLFSSGL